MSASEGSKRDEGVRRRKPPITDATPKRARPPPFCQGRLELAIRPGGLLPRREFASRKDAKNPWRRRRRSGIRHRSFGSSCRHTRDDQTFEPSDSDLMLHLVRPELTIISLFARRRAPESPLWKQRRRRCAHFATFCTSSSEGTRRAAACLRNFSSSSCLRWTAYDVNT